jgi:UDPglucose 6-dehydrogenase
MQKIKIGIMGLGMVGGAMRRYFESRGYVFGQDLFGFDPGKNLNDMDALNREASVVFISVPTPYHVNPENGVIGHDLSYVQKAFASLTGEKTVVIKSTVLPGTTDEMAKANPKHRVLFNPEFLTESTADQDMGYPDRQIIGYTSEASQRVAKDALLLLPLAPFERVMPAKSAEMVKYYGNTWFSTKVVFANQMYDMCQALGVDYDAVKESASADKRIGPSHLDIWHGGFRGYGGKCLPKDTRALIQLGDSVGAEMKLLKAVEHINTALVSSQEHDKDR